MADLIRIIAVLLLASAAHAQLDPGAVEDVAGAPAATADPDGPPSPESLRCPQLKSDPKLAGELGSVFWHYGTACYGLNWEVLCAVGAAESGLDPKQKTGSYVGLFQWKKADCKDKPSYIDAYPFLDCGKLEDPETNAAISAARFHRYLKGERFKGGALQADATWKNPILERCKDPSVSEVVALMYTGHNNGGAVLKHVLAKGACKLGETSEAKAAKLNVSPSAEDLAGWAALDTQWKAVMDYYDSKPKAAAEEAEGCNARHPEWEGKLAHRYVREGQGHFKCVNANYGVEKWLFGLDKIAKAKSTGGDGLKFYLGEPKPEFCPANTGRRIGE